MYASQTSTKPSVVWQGSTKDGYTLRLSRSALTQIGSKLKQTGLEHLVRRLRSNNQSSLESAVMGAIAQVVSNATRSRSGQNTQVFTAVGKTRKYQIATQPIGHQQSAILVVRSLPLEFKNEFEGEFEYKYESELWNESEGMVGPPRGGGRGGSQQAGPSRQTASPSRLATGMDDLMGREKIAGEAIKSTLRSREGSVVYITARHVYKILGTGTQPHDLWETYNTLRTGGLPVPDTVVFRASIEGGGKNPSDVRGLRSKLAFGSFFQMSKKGGEQILINEIKLVTNRELLRTIIYGLTKAQELGVTDPQGFIARNSNPPLTFIDLHRRELPTITFEKVLKEAQKRLVQLESLTPSRASSRASSRSSSPAPSRASSRSSSPAPSRTSSPARSRALSRSSSQRSRGSSPPPRSRSPQPRRSSLQRRPST
jgi:hypothetical protein